MPDSCINMIHSWISTSCFRKSSRLISKMHFVKHRFSRCDRALTQMTFWKAVTNKFRNTFSKYDTCTNANISFRYLSNFNLEKNRLQTYGSRINTNVMSLTFVKTEFQESQRWQYDSFIHINITCSKCVYKFRLWDMHQYQHRFC